MPITLQVVGVYYKEVLNIDLSSDPVITPKKVLDFAQENPTGDVSLGYAFAQTPGGNYVDFIAATFANNFASPVSGTEYVAGTYGLAQSFTSMNAMTYSVWQYYIFDSTGMPVKLPKPELPFDDPNAKAIRDKYTLIWRLVTICGASRVTTGANLTSVRPTLNVNARFAKILGQPFSKV